MRKFLFLTMFSCSSSGTEELPSNCDPNYAGACIPVVSYDLDCKDVSAKRFRVIGTDIQRFDRDGDGIACEPKPR